MGFSKSNRQIVAIYSAIIGLLYMATGLLEIFGGFGVEVSLLAGVANALYVVGDIFAGFVLVVIGAVYLRGLIALSKGEREGLSYVTVGALLSASLLGLYLFTIFSNGLGLALSFEDWLEWTWLEDLRPGLLLGVLAIPAMFIALKKSWRE